LEKLQSAKKLLKECGYTCVFITDGIWTTSERGVKPLLTLLESEKKVAGGVAADKVVGKAAAFLYVLLKVSAIYACVISEPALEVLQGAGIKVETDKIVPFIRNRTDTGNCPMETLVWSITDAYQAYEEIKKKIKEQK
jgi:hypothetical protein